jgi:hypothetical protein
MINRNIHIFYRHYNVDITDNKNRPSWFNYESCFRNLLSTLNKNINLTILYDNKIPGNNWIHKYKNQNDIEFIEFEGGGDWESFIFMKTIIDSKNIPQTDLLYFLENDYLHEKNWTHKILELYSTYSGLNYVSLYDHNDKYFLPMYKDLTSKIITTNSHHWRTTPSTCASFIIEKSLYDLDKDILFSIPGDHNKFLYLNETRNRYVLTPIPGLSTHCMEGLMSPTIDWKHINNKII